MLPQASCTLRWYLNRTLAAASACRHFCQLLKWGKIKVKHWLISILIKEDSQRLRKIRRVVLPLSVYLFDGSQGSFFPRNQSWSLVLKVLDDRSPPRNSGVTRPLNLYELTDWAVWILRDNRVSFLKRLKLEKVNVLYDWRISLFRQWAGLWAAVPSSLVVLLKGIYTLSLLGEKCKH